ncbi:hypothetical protein BIU97_10625 [Curtobacterium sp. MCBA15_009]|uniref:choice-of-anchor G family protein n=1 Tax=Curtobacterium sp. MCBA15_009 TaxID=1898737 RepID=UPI0008DDE5EB|nr:choice-of-anchor G family protein [Curtobacterium sp. MCBA15_009]OII10570.1 hypothetical protein BIU97_10625 [Curtobacterium sp. MCBA15_009]
MAALVAALAVIQPAAAAQNDVAEAEGVLLSGSGIVDADGIVQLGGAYSNRSATGGGGTANQPLDLEALRTVGVDLGNDVDLLGPNGLLTLGVDGQYATTAAGGATASSGLLTNDGGIGVGTGSGTGAATLDLQPLFSRVGADATLLSRSQLRVGALASRLQTTRGATVETTSDYRIADASLGFTSPAVAALTTSLGSDLGTFSDRVDATVGADGALAGTTTALTAQLQRLLRGTALGLVTVNGTTVRATVDLDLRDTLTRVLQQPLTDGAVTITPSTGSITVDLDDLTTLNGQPANTPVLTAAAVDSINRSITTILGTRLPAALQTAVVSTINATPVTVDVTANVSLAGAPLTGLALRADTTLGDLAGTGAATATVTATRGPLGLTTLATLLAPAVNSVVVPALQTIVRPLVTGDALTGLGTTLTATTTGVSTALAPVVLLLRQVIDLTVNAQDATTGFRDPRGYDPGARSVHALRLSVLPGPDVATVDLATSTVRAAAVTPPTITAPTAGQQFSVPSATSTRTIRVSGTGEPGGSIALDLGGGRTGAATVAADGSWTTTVPGVPTGDQTVTATQTVAGAAAVTTTQSFSVVAQRALVVTSPTAGQTFTTTGTTAPVTLTGTATANAGIDVDLGGGLTASGTADGSGAWSVTVPSVPVGDQTARVTQTVGDSTSAAVTRAFRVVAAADLTVDRPTEGQDLPLVGDIRSIAFSGTAQAGARVDVDLGDGRTATTTANSDGSWSATVADVPAGRWTAHVTQTTGGSTSEPVDRTVTVTAAPALTVDAPVDGSTVTVADDSSTTPVTVSGSAAPDARVHVGIGGSFTSDVDADGDGRWTTTFVGVPVGDRTVTARQTVDGATSAPVTSTFSVAAGDPLVVTSPDDGDVVTVLDADTTTDLDLTGTAEPRAAVRVSLGDGLTATTTALADGSWATTVEDVPVGRYTVTATQTVGGTTGSAVRQVVTVQAGAPLAVTTPTQGATVRVATDDSVVDVTVRGTAQPGARIDVVLDDGDTRTTRADAQGDWSLTLPSVATGDHTAAVTQTVDGETSAPVERDLTVAAGAALVVEAPGAAQQVPAGTDGTADVVVRGTAEPGATVAVTVDDGDPVRVVVDTEGNWVLPSSPLGIGEHTVRAVETVTGTDGPVVTRDFTVVPGTGVVIDSPASGSRFVVVDGDATATVPVTGTAEPGATVVVSAGPGIRATTTADAAGAWRVVLDGLAPTGDRTVTASQEVDGVTTTAVPTTFTVDTASALTVTGPGTDPILVAGPDVQRDVTLTGAGQPGATVRVTGDGFADQRTTIGDDGTWTVSLPDLGVGSHPVSVTQTLPGTVSDPRTSDPVDRTIELDAAPPVRVSTPDAGAVLLVPDADATRDVAVTGTASAGAPVAVRLGDTTMTTTADGDGAWTVTFPGVGVGAVSLTASQTVGGTTASAPAQTVTVRAGTRLTLVTPADGAVLTVADASGTADVRASGRAQAGAEVTVRLSTGETRTTAATADGDWAVTFRDVPVGDHRVTATQLVGGGTSAPVSAAVSVRAGAPLAVTTPADATTVTVADADATTDVRFAGTGQPGATVTVDLGDGGSATARVDGDGDWSATVRDVPRGSFTASVTQSVGGTTSVAVERPVSVLAAAPLTVRQPGDDPITVADDAATTTVTVAGDAQPGATVTVTVDRRDPVEVTARDDGSWTVDVPRLGVGPHTVQVTQTVGGSTSTEPVRVPFEVEAAAPVEIDSPTAGQVVTVADRDATTTITVSGTAEPGATVLVDLGDGHTASTTADGDGAWTVSVPDVPAGTTTVSVTQRVGDTESSPETVTVRVVVADPITIATPADGSTVRVAQRDSLATVTASGAAQAGAAVRVSVDGGDARSVTATDAGTWSARLTDLGVGDHTVRATQTVGDSTSGPVRSTFTVAPGAALTVTAPTDGTTFTVPASAPTTTVPVSGRGEPGATVRIVRDDEDAVAATVGPDGVWSAVLPAVGRGDHTVTVTQVVGGTTSDPVVRTVTVAVAPAAAVVITRPVDGTAYRVLGGTTDVRVVGTAAPGAPVTVRVDDGTAVTTVADDDGTWAVTVTDVGTGAHSVTARQTVDGDTTDAAAVGFTVTAAAPVTVTSPTDGQRIPTTGTTASVPVRGTAEPGAVVTVDVDGHTVTTTAGDDGSWTVTVGDVPPGDHTVSVTETVGGRTSAPVTTGITVVVAQPTAITITSPVPGQLVPATGPGDTGTFRVTGHATPRVAVRVTLSDGQVRTTTADDDGDWTVVFDRVPEGDWMITASQSVNGTTSTAPPVRIVVDAIEPVAITSPAPGEHRTASADGTVAWRVTGTAEPRAVVTLVVDDGNPVTTTADDTGAWSVVVRMAVGPHTIRVTETVGTATSAPQTVSVTVDAAAASGTPGTPGGVAGPGTGTGGLPGTGTGGLPGSGSGNGSGAGPVTGGLAFTGADVAPIAGTATGLLLLGVLLLGLSRLARRVRRGGHRTRG